MLAFESFATKIDIVSCGCIPSPFRIMITSLPRARARARGNEETRSRLGGDAEQSWCCTRGAWSAGERYGASGGSGHGLPRGAGGTDARTGAARLGGNAEHYLGAYF